MKKSKKILKINDIIIEEDAYPRSNWSWQTSYDYAESLRAGAKFPPITVAKLDNKFYLVDGRHRLEAVKSLNKKEKKKEIYIQAEVLTGLNRKQMYEESVMRNMAHGRQFSPYEKRLIVVKLKSMRYSFDKISTLVQIKVDKLDDFTTSTMSSSFTTGNPIVVKAPLKNNPVVTEEAIKAQGGISAQNQVMIFKQANIILENDLLNKDNETVMCEVAKLKKYLASVKFKRGKNNG